jgi:ribonuclease HIII
MDEAGKGDWFGPLVVAAVYADPATLSALKRAGVRDSKQLKPEAIRILAKQIEAIIPASMRHVEVLIPSEYNRRYPQLNNQNLLLAEVYAECARPVWEASRCNYILCDQFSQDVQRLDDVFSTYRLPLPFQQHRAEEASLAVAAASILASATFSRQLEVLGEQAGMDRPLPRGASDQAVLELMAKLILEKQGKQALGNFAKLNFMPVRQLLSRETRPVNESISSFLRNGPPVQLKVRAWEKQYHPDGYWMVRFRDGGILLWYSETTGKLFMSGKPTAPSYQLLKDKVKNRYWTKGIEDIEKSIRNLIPEYEEAEVNSVLGVGWERTATLLGARFDIPALGSYLFRVSQSLLLVRLWHPYLIRIGLTWRN